MNARVSMFLSFAVTSLAALAALSGCADDDVLPIPHADAGGDSSAPADSGTADGGDRGDGATAGDAASDGATAPVDASTDGAVGDGGGHGDASTSDAGNDAGVSDSGSADAGSHDAAALTCLPTGSTITVVNQNASAYLINGVANGPLTLCRGSSYTFGVTAPGHPFYIKTVQSSGTANSYSDGVVGNGTETGLLTFAVPSTAPASLVYNCSVHFGMSGPITVVGP